MQHGKQAKLLSEYITKVAQGKRAMILGADFVVLSRNIYDELLKRHDGLKGIDLLDIDDPIDICADQDLIYDEIEERQRREYPRDK